MTKASKVVVIVFDGLRPDMVTTERMPRLAAFAEGSLWFREARSVFPSMTRVATSSIATGALPVVHGVVGNNFYFPDVSTDFVFDTSRAADLALARERLGGPLLTAPTFADRLAAEGRSMAVVHSGSAGSAYAINPSVAANRHWTFSVMGEANTQTPEAVREVVARFGPLPPRNLPRFEEIDYATRVMTELVLAEMNPDVALIWFNEPDTSFHYRFLGSANTQKVMAHADAAFGRIMDAVAARADAAEVAVIVASDHGQISSHGAVAMDDLLTAAGHPAAMASKRPLNGAAVTVTGGNMGEIRMRDGDLDRRDAIARWLMGRDDIGMVFTAAADPVAGAVPGTFSTSLVGLDHARGPDLVYILRSDDGADDHGLPGRCLITAGDVPVGGGMHGGLNRHELNTVLMLGGAAARGGGTSNTPVGIIDIGPTILDLLGIAPAATMQGMSVLAKDLDAGRTMTHTASAGSFHQQLTLVTRGTARIILQGGRVGPGRV